MNVVTVTQVNTYIKSILDADRLLKTIYVVGEISNLVNYYRSGHIYLTLKDDKTQLKAVMFATYASRLKFALADGMRVVCRGRISCYDKDGIYQLYIEDIQPDGLGSLALAYEQLKAKLAEEGLFDEKYKKPIPRFPQKIGVATSNSGAAVEDIKNITKRRYPLCELIIAPTIVQGDNAPADIVKSLEMLDSIEDIDLIIVGRGGGSAEDLWAFNDERVARTVFACKKPVISAVGHETDFTICDLVADMRAPTPSAAAELAVPSIDELACKLNNYKSSLSALLLNKLENQLLRFDKIINSCLSEPADYIQNKMTLLCELNEDLIKAYSQIVDSKKLQLSSAAGLLDSLSPLAVLARGYCSATDKDNKIIKSVNSVKKGDALSLTLSDGNIKCIAQEVNYNEQ